MKSLFWTHTIWYIALAVICVAMVTISLINSLERKKTMAFFFAVLGMTYFMEVFLLLIGNAYAYYPKIASDSFHESLIGNFFSQYSVSASAVLLATLGLNIWWRIGFAIAYFLVDVLFVHLGIYSHNWYRSWYTLGGFFLYSWIVKKWHEKSFSHPSRMIYFITLFLGVFTIAGNAIGTTLNFLEIRRFSSGLFDQATKDHTATSFIYGIWICLILIVIYRLRLRPALKCLTLLMMLAIDYGLYRAGVITVKPGWYAAIALLIVFGRYFVVGMVDRLLGGKATHT